MACLGSQPEPSSSRDPSASVEIEEVPAPGAVTEANDYLDPLSTSSSLTEEIEIRQALREVSQICERLKTGGLQPAIVSEALLLAIRCAASRNALEKELSVALTDDLTGLHNRRAFMALGEHQLKLARRTAQSALLFFIDLDNLKKVNDAFGHREGDLAIVRSGLALRETFRDSDIMARYGGDEFAILALETSSQNEEVIVSRITESLRKINDREPRYEVRLSIGSARFDPQLPMALDELIAQADQAMYVHKRTRRNSP